MRRILAVSLLLVASVTAFACEEDENRPRAANEIGQAPSGGAAGAGGGGGGAGEGGVTDAGSEGGGACNTIDINGNVVDQNRIVGDPATGNGGTVAEGTYELSGADVYIGNGGATPGPSGVTYQGVLRVLPGGKMERAMRMQANQGATPVETRSAGDFVAAGTTMTITQSCPAPFQDQYTYTVLNNTLNLTSLLTKESFTFTLR